MNDLKNARLAAGLTQRQVAEKPGIRESAYQNYETGRTLPNVIAALKIADVLNSRVENLYLLNNQGSR
jgi:DNA-binding XRE family transcriptional regulator